MRVIVNKEPLDWSPSDIYHHRVSIRTYRMGHSCYVGWLNLVFLIIIIKKKKNASMNSVTDLEMEKGACIRARDFEF